jgi:E3 ubiquitin-protein ligase BRE1
LCPPDDLLLCRLIQKDSIEGGSNDKITYYVEKTLALCQLSTRELLKLIQDTVDDQMERIKDIGQVLHEDLSIEGIIHMRYYAMILLN